MIPTLTTEHQRHYYSTSGRARHDQFDYCHEDDDGNNEYGHDNEQSFYKGDCFLLLKPLLHAFGLGNDERRRKKNGFDYVDTWGDEQEPDNHCPNKQRKGTPSGLFRGDWDSTSTITMEYHEDEDHFSIEGTKHDTYEKRQVAGRGLLKQASSKTLTTVTRTTTSSMSSLPKAPIKSALKELEVWDILDLTGGGGSFDNVAAAKAWTQLQKSNKYRK